MKRTCAGRFHGSHRHPLAIDRIETAQGVAENEIAAREAGQFFVMPAQVCAELIWPKRGKRLSVSDNLENLRFLQAAREFNVARLVGGRMIAEIATQGYDPAVVLLCQNDPKPPSGWHAPRITACLPLRCSGCRR